jgi:hypothetical protein
MATVQPRSPGRRVVRRPRAALDAAIDVALAELPAELRPLAIQYADNIRQGQEIRSALSTVLTRNHLRWRDVDQAVRPLVSQGTA